MPTIEEGMAAVEARLDTLDDIRSSIAGLRSDVDSRLAAMDSRIESLIEREDRHFLTAIGVQMSVAVAMIATLLVVVFG